MKRRSGVFALLVVTGASVATIVAPGSPTATLPAVLVIAALAALGVLVAIEHRGNGPSTRAVVVAIGLVLLVAVCVTPRRSHDLWSYASYGSIVARHDASPYAHAPDEYPDDPLVQRVAPGWRRTRSVYGPLFTALSAAIVRTTGGRPFPTRLAFQGLSLLCVVGVLILLARRGCSPTTLALVGLHPIVTVYVVNGGHNDALVALLLFGAATATARRPVVGGFLIGTAASIKLTALLPILGLAWWAWRRHGRPRTLAAIGVAIGVPLMGYVLAGGRTALAPLLAASGRTSRASLWGIVHVLGDPGIIANHLGVIAALATLTFALPLVTAAADHQRPDTTLAAPLLAYVLLGAYVLPWYLIWVLPFAALELNTRWARTFLTISALTVVAYQYAPSGSTALTSMLHASMPATQLAAAAGVFVLALEATRRSVSRNGPSHFPPLVTTPAPTASRCVPQ